jgi:hypothetical protein
MKLKYMIPAATMLAAGAVFSQAAMAAPPQKESVSFKGDNASVWVSHYEPGVGPSPDISCGTITDVNISAMSNVAHGGPGKPTVSTEISAVIYSYDSCTGETLFIGYGVLPKAGFVSNGTKSATINGTIDMLDWYYGGSTAPLSVSLTLTGVGDASQSNYHSNDRWGNMSTNTRSKGSYREATASGDVVWMGADLMESSSSSASLSTVSSGYRVMTKY